MSADAKVLATAFLVAAALGCDVTELPDSPPAAPTPPVAAEPAPPKVALDGTSLEIPEIETPVTNDPRPFNSHDPIKGRRSRLAGGKLGADAAANFHMRHQIVINSVKQALGYYMAEHGDFPQSNEEFMEGIIKASNIELPELEPEHEYIYVPEEAVVGLQIRLKQPAAAEAAVAEPSEPAPAEAATGEEEGEAGEPGDPSAESEPEPIYNIRERAAALGGQAPEVEEP